MRTSHEYAVPLVALDAFQLTRFYIELSTVNLERKFQERHVFEKPNNTKEARVQPQKYRTQDKREDTDIYTVS